MAGGLSPPQIMNSMRDGSIIVRHREYIGDVNGTTAFNVSGFPLNPGQGNTFPWLSQIAGAFEQYRWRGLIFEFKSTYANVVSGTDGHLGTVIMSTDYNSPQGANYYDKLSMENAEFANSCKPTENIIHPIECKASLNPLTKLWVRTGGLAANEDLRLYDLGQFYLATTNFQANTNGVGELWATYEIEFYKTKFNYAEASENAYDRFTMSTGITSSAAWGTAAVASSRNTLGGSINATGTTYTFPTGVTNLQNYLWVYHVTGQTPAGTGLISVTNWTATYTPTGSTVGSGLMPVLSFASSNGGTKDNYALAGHTMNGSTSSTAVDLVIMGTCCISGVTTGIGIPINFTFGLTNSLNLPSGTGLKGDFMIMELPQGFSSYNTTATSYVVNE